MHVYSACVAKGSEAGSEGGVCACRGQTCPTNLISQWLLKVKDGLLERQYPISHVGFSHIRSVVQTHAAL